MKKPAISAKLLWIALAMLCAAGTWLYTYRVLIPAQVAYAQEHDLPRGNESDLYPRWVGARELLLHARDPYTIEVTREIQMGFYGRVLPPDQPGAAQNYQQGFYYPVYVAFFLAPTFDVPFKTVQHEFFWLLFVLTVVTIPLWLRLLDWRAPLWAQAAMAVLTVGSLPLMQGLMLGQMTLLVAPLLAGALVLLTLDRQFAAGILLALATIKPQLVLLVLFWLAIWTLGDWRRRYRWAASFVLSMALLCGASEYYLPHWILRFWQALREYRSYTGEMSATAMLMGPWSRILELFAFVFLIAICWRQRRQPAKSEAFAVIVSLVLAITVLLVPSYGPYNQALLLPALLILVRDQRRIWAKDAVNRFLAVIAIVVIGWPWLTSVVLTGLSFVLPPATVQRGSLMPFWTALGIPPVLAAATLVYAWQRSFAPSQSQTTS